jgi:hypothetical protein
MEILKKMVEIIKHSLGLCGEHYHPNIFTILTGSLGIIPGINYLYFRYIKKIKYKK